MGTPMNDWLLRQGTLGMMRTAEEERIKRLKADAEAAAKRLISQAPKAKK